MRKSSLTLLIARGVENGTPVAILNGQAAWDRRQLSMSDTGDMQMSRLIGYYSPLDRVFDRAFGSAPSLNGDAVVANGSIKLDVVETPEAFVVKAELPGIAKDKIEVNVEDRNVTIGAEFVADVDANAKALWQERSVGKISRAIRLPEAVDANAAQATHVDGVLQLTLPKVAKANSKQITIQ
jgi:HSP20 family protein